MLGTCNRKGIAKLGFSSAAILAVSLFLMVFVAPVFAQSTLYVDDNDSICGGKSPCYSTIQAAINAASPGNTIQVAAGTYIEDILLIKSVSLIGTDRDTTIVKPSSTNVYGFTIQIPGITGTVTISGITFDGDNKSKGIFVNGQNPFGAGELVFDNLVSKNTGQDRGYGIFVYNGRATIKNSEFFNNERAGIVVFGGANVNSGPTLIQNNVFYNNGKGSNPSGDDGYDFDMWLVDYREDITVTENTITGNRAIDEVGIVVHNTMGGASEKALIEDNTITDARVGIAVWVDAIMAGSYQVVEITKNIISGGTDGIELYKGPGVTPTPTLWTTDISGSLENANDISGYSDYALKLIGWPNDVSAESNYWGVSTESEIEDKILHNHDNGALGTVDYDPWISENTANIEEQTTEGNILNNGDSVDTTNIKGIDSLVFDIVLGGGPYSATVIKYDVAPSNSPSGSGFSFAGNYYELTTDMADGTFTATIVFSYVEDVGAPGYVNGIPEENLKVSYYDGVKWVVIDGILDTVHNTYTITVNHFTQFSLIGTTSVDAYDITPDWAKASQQDVGILDLEFTNSGTLADTIIQIKVTSKNTNDADVSQVEIFEDTDDDGVFEPGAGDTSKGTAIFSGGIATINIAVPITVPASGTKHVFVAYDTAAGATHGNTLDAEIAAGDIIMTNAGTNLGELNPAGQSTLDTDNPASSGVSVTPTYSSSNPTVTATCQDLTSNIVSAEYKADVAGSWNSLSASDDAFDEQVESVDGSVNTIGLSPGLHTIFVICRDAAGNIDLLPDTYDFTFDNVGPSTSLTTDIPDYTNQNTWTVSGTATDTTTNIADVDYKIDAGSWWDANAENPPWNSKSESFYFNTGALADGQHTVSARAADQAGNIETTASDTFCVDTTNPVAEANGHDSGDEGSAISFSSAGSSDMPVCSGIEKYEWDFHYDGTFNVDSTQQNPSNTYNDNGVYTIALRITDKAGNAHIDSATVTVNDKFPTASLTGTTPVNEGTSNEYDASGSTSSPDAIVKYEWDWSYDGIAFNVEQDSDLTNKVYHTYDDNGNYKVAVRVTDDDGSKTIATFDVAVLDLGPTANFNHNAPQPEGTAVSFTDTSTSSPDAITSWSWTFGDGGTSTLQNPTHAYSEEGTYTVTLTVTDEDGSTDPQSYDITINDVNPTASFTHDAPKGEGTVVNFDASTSTAGSPTDAITLYEWDWTSDGIYDYSSATPTATHTYMDDGTYTVKLKVTDEDSFTETTGTFTINDLTPTANAGIDQTIDEGQTINVDGSASTSYPDTITLYEWDWTSNGVYDATGITAISPVYADNGVYTVTLRATDEDGDKSTDTLQVTVNDKVPTASFTSDSPRDEGAVMTFTDTSTSSPDLITSWSWAFGDGGTSISQNPTHTYAQDGTYTVSLTVIDDDGSTNTKTDNDVTVINVAPIISGVVAVPDTIDEGSSTSVTITASDPGADTLSYSFDWTNDGIYDIVDQIGNSASHTYTADGTYTVKVRVKDDDTETTDTIIITVNNVAPTITAISTASPIDEGSSTTFTATATDVGSDDSTLNYDIDWGDGTFHTTGTTTGSISKTHQYKDDDADDKYTITLIVTDSDLVTDVETIQITVNNVNPVANAGGPYSCNEGETKTLTASATDVGTLDSFFYAWDLDNDEQFDDDASQSVDFACTQDGTYNVAVQVTDDDGGVDTDATTVTVANVAPTIPTDIAGFPANLYVGNILTVTGSGSTDVPADLPLTYYYKFENANDGTILKDWSTANSYTIAVDDAHDTIKVSTKSYDGDAYSPEYSETDFVDNTIPTTPTNLAADDNKKVDEDIGASCSDSTDADNDVLTYHYEFYNTNDAATRQAYSTDNTYTVQQSDAHDSIRVRCKAYDGRDYSGEDEVTVSIANTVPTTPTYDDLSPVSPVITSTLTGACSGSTDVDGDSLTYYYRFYSVTDSAYREAGFSTTDTYVLTAPGDSHDTFRVDCYANDGFADSGTRTGTTTRTVVNTAPITPTDLAGFPANLYVGNILTVTGSGSTDADNDALTYYYKFENVEDEAIVQDWSTSNSYTIAVTDAHNTIRVYVKTNDGTIDSPEYSETDTVDNTAPTTPTTINADNNKKVGETISASCSGSTDADNDALTYYYEFYNSVDSSMVQPYSTANIYTIQVSDAHDTIKIRCKANDGTADSGEKETTVNVENTVPVVTLTAPNGGENWKDTQTIIWTATDADGDTLSIDLKYDKDGTGWVVIASGENNDGSYSWDTTAAGGDSNDYLVRVTANDNYGGIVSDESDDAFTLDNTNPSVGFINVNPTSGIFTSSDFEISAPVSDATSGIDTTSCEYTIDGTTWQSGTYDAATKLCKGAVSGQADGTLLTINVRVKDNAGNQDEGSSISLTVDAVPPEFGEFTSPTAGSSYNVGDSMRITIPVSDAKSGIENDQTCWVTIGGTQMGDVIKYSESTGTCSGTVVVPSGLTQGNNDLVVRVVDRVGLEGISSPISINIQTEPAGVPTLKEPADASYVNADPALKWNDVADAADYWLQVDDDIGFSSPAVGQVVEGTSYSTAGLDENREYYWHVAARDADGGLGQYSDTWWFAIDKTVPDDFSINQFGNVNGQIEYAVSDLAATDIEKVVFEIDPTVGQRVEFSVDFEAPFQARLDTTEYPDGSARVYATAYDRAGNAKSSTPNWDEIIIDNTGPIIAITSPSGGSEVSGIVSIVYTATDAGVGVASAEIRIDGGDWAAIEESPYSWDTTTLTEQDHTVQIRAMDGLGNAGYSAIMIYTIDNTPECIAFTAPIAGEWYTEDQVVEVTAPDDTSRVDFSGTCGLSPASDTDGSNGWTSTADLDTGDGSCTISATAYDELGNSICTRELSVNRDNTAPVMTDADVVDDGDGYDTDGDLTVTLLATDSEIGVDHYHVTVTHTGTSQTAESDVTELFASFNDIPLDGEWCAEVYAVDKLGNEGSAISTGCIIVDREAPDKIEEIFGGENIETTNNGQDYDIDSFFDIFFDASYDANGIGYYEIERNGDIIEAGFESEDGYMYFNQAGLSDGTYRYKVRAIDNAGNVGEWSDTYTVIVDTEAPEILFVNPIHGGFSAPDTTLSVVTNENAVCEYGFTEFDFDDGVEMDGETTTHAAALEGLDDGENKIYVVCVDSAGNDEGSYIAFTVTSELPQTSATVVDPYYTSTNPTITAQIESETSPIEDAKYCLKRPWEQRPARDAECFTFNAQDENFDEMKETVEAEINIEGLDEGIWVAYANARDSVGWGEYDAYPFIIDRVAPIMDEQTPSTIRGDGECREEYRGEEDYGWVCEGGTEFELVLETNEDAYCEYSDSEFGLGGGTAFEQGQWTGQHITPVTVPEDGVYTYYVICKDYADLESQGTIQVTVDSVFDSTPPEVISSAPDGMETTGEVTLTAVTDEYAHCEYSTTQFAYGAGTRFGSTGTTLHTQALALEDGSYTYFVRCEDYRGNVMETTEEIIFEVDTMGNFGFAKWLYQGWQSFSLPKLILNNIGFCPHGGPYSVMDVLSSIDGEDPGFDVIWYYDGTGWLGYSPTAPAWMNTLTEFNDEISNPYFIKMNRKDRLEINGQEDCGV